MKVCIIGPGAMGCLFAARLSRSGIRTTLVDFRKERIRRLSASGITVKDLDGEFTEHVRVVSSVPSDQQLIIVLVKSYSTRDLQIPVGTPVLTLQNGFGNAETLCSMVGSHLVLAGVTYEAATLLGEGLVAHTATGITRLGSWTSCSTEVAERVLKRSGFTVELTEAPGQAIWEKVVINSAINPLTAILGVPNGKLLEIPEARQLMRDLVVEGAKAATSEGYRFPYSLVEKTEEVCAETKDNISSMLQDIRAGKRTEIDAICGEILNRAQLTGLPAPRMRVVWQLLKALEKR